MKTRLHPSVSRLAAVLLTATAPHSAPGQSFVDVTATVAPGLPSGSWIAWGDYDNDDDPDLLTHNAIWRNNGGTNFTATGLIGGSFGPGLWGDYDNDGYLDAFFVQSDVLMKNLNGTAFSAVLMPPLQVPSAEFPTGTPHAANWADHDGDGLLDLYVTAAGWPQPFWPDARFRNLGGGASPAFTNVWEEAPGTRLPGRGVNACDFDQDGDMDIFVCKYRLQPNLLLQNDGTGSFINVASTFNADGMRDTPPPPGEGEYGQTIGAAWGDLDNDGYFDLFVGNFAHDAGWNGIVERQPESEFLRSTGPTGSFHFVDMAATANLVYQEAYSSPTLGDVDNDGDLDLYFASISGSGQPVLYRNEGNWVFSNVTAAAGLGSVGQTAQACLADYDDDGDLDLVTNGKIYQNQGNTNHWLKVKIVGNGTTVNRAGFGTQVRIRDGASVITRQVEGSIGEGNQNDQVLHFGLGSQAGPVDLEIRAPDGSTGLVENVAVDQAIELEVPPVFFGPELITNGTFDTDASEWSLSTVGSWNATEGDPDPGSLQVHDPGGTGAAAVEFVDAVSPSTRYRFEFTVKDLDGGNQIFPWVRTEDTDSGGSVVDSTYTYLGTPVTTGLYFLANNVRIDVTSSWQTFSITIDSGPAAETLRIQLTHGGATDRIVYDSFSLRQVFDMPPPPPPKTYFGAERVVNGSFDSDLSGWNMSSGVNWNADDAEGGTGSAALDGGNGGAHIHQFMPIEEGKRYRFSFDARSVTSNFQYFPFVQCENSGGSAVASEWTYLGATRTNGFYYLMDGTLINVETDWTHYELEVLAGAGAETFRFQWTPGGETRETRIDNVSLIELFDALPAPRVITYGVGAGASTVDMVWESVGGALYTIEEVTDLVAGSTSVVTNDIAGVPPTNTTTLTVSPDSAVHRLHGE